MSQKPGGSWAEWAEYARLACLPWGRGQLWPFPPLRCLPQNRAQLCVLSDLWENLAFFLPAHLSVCLTCLFGNLCVRCKDVHPVTVVP